MPYSLEAEQSVLGAVLIDPSCFALVMENLRSAAFYRPQHQQIFDVMTNMFNMNRTMDFITILDAVKGEQIFETDEDAKIYLTNLAQVVPSSANVEAYCRIVREKYYVRRLITASREIIDMAQESQAESDVLLDSAEQSIFDIRQGRNTSSFKHIRTAITETYELLQHLSGEDRDKYKGISTGYPALDRVITGLNKTDLILIAARPGMGKTSLALNIAENVATKGGRTVAVFSLEMSSEQLAQRLLSSQASVEGQLLRTGELTGDDWVRIAMASQVLSKADVYLDDTPGITVGEMKAKLRRLKKVDLVIIDYLQLMSTGRRSENRVQEVSEITRNLKIMAKELNVPVITLSQLSRGPESRTTHKPMLSDLRESGSIEQDADIVLLLYREDYYAREEAEERNIAECDVAKNRHGEVGVVKLGWDNRYTRFTNLELGRDEP
ncbi:MULTISPECIES: replicative DNA helicase [Anaerotruncus]|uniref:Replicative DNA helicase n=2 Tax=Anaerotruncus TaxID=244127 RepID=A0A498CNZ5_9FIRM|nr:MULTISPECIES: replicative DNA helicase [Anaerotruncus]MBC3937970.1 replicative DNA helicase [Anaerotruncus massiliensis (ex Togo et al. 2019)]MCQ4895220.1 replicative DNA helicase [Anaerotruncus sp. DFI.9.16]RLL13634.1 replicative DNA helicase [Anaerotruncus massiliensis (ex Liu et al. 2021)]